MIAAAALERDGIAFARPSHSSSLVDRVIQTSGDSAYGHHALAALWRDAGLPEAALDYAALDEAPPLLASSFAVDAAARAAIGAAALAAAELFFQRGGVRQCVSVGATAAAAAFHSERLLRIAGRPAADFHDAVGGLYRTGDGGWVRLHTAFPHHREGLLRLLACPPEREAVAAALARRGAEAFETEATEAGLCVAALRRFSLWDALAHGQAVAARPVRITRIGPAPARPLPAAERPLAGVRVLDLTRVIAGPVCGRALASHGADVLLITAPHLPAIAPLVVDTGPGKRAAFLDLRQGADRGRLAALLAEADILVQGYRPGALAALGFGPAEAARVRPGIVAVSLSAYGEEGPWHDRRGFDSLVQTATGFNAAEAEAASESKPRPLPVQALDHASGYLMAFGALAALHRRATEGGSWDVRVSLAATARWLRGLGRAPDGFARPAPAAEAFADCMVAMQSPFGALELVRPPAAMALTPARWDRPPVPLGTHPPSWA